MTKTSFHASPDAREKGSIDPAPDPGDGGAVSEPPYIVAIGASAGGLESLERLFRNLEPDTGMAFVVLQHLSPDFKSMMSELLGRDTSMKIHRAEEGMLVAANSVYLLPPKKEMVLQDRRLRLKDKDTSKGICLPIDLFFESLAIESGSRAIAVVLSGSGSDGSRGIVEIAKHGGLVISETQETAKFGGMPGSAAATGVVDEILPPEEIGALIKRIATHPQVTRAARTAALAMQHSRLRGMEAIYQMYRENDEIDFSVYKETTVLRRIQRRVMMLGLGGVDEYADRLLNDSQERESLYCDLLIGVTQFFRDRETFELLCQTVLPDLVEGRGADNPLRVWVAGCATGEEPYSIAIAIHEAFAAAGKPVALKLFATDVHKASILHAGRGIYSPESLASMSPDRIEKYFVSQDGGYQVSSQLRQSIVFAPHNVLRDAPFTDLDLVSCRNLLIYFQIAAQQRALSMFHYSLKRGGVLLLGGSESPGDLADEFDVVNERSRLYRKRHDGRLPNEFRTPLESNSALELHASRTRLAPAVDRSRLTEKALHNQLLNRFMPPCLLINENRELIDTFGGAEKFLQLRARKPSLDVLELLDANLRGTLAGAIRRTLKENKPIHFSNVTLTVGGESTAYRLTVSPMTDSSTKGTHHAILFEPQGRSALPSNETLAMPAVDEVDALRDHIGQLEEDLKHSRENLQATIEELETSNEELQATNEELIASNEELQSTNEELHSVNEELYTVNAEHQRKIGELAELSQDMSHLLENTDVAIVFLDKELCVRRFTSKVVTVFDLLPNDVGRPIKGFLPRFEIDDLVGRLQQVLDTGVPVEIETATQEGTSYLLRMLPYRAGSPTENPEDDSVEGVVMMLVDVSSVAVLRERLRWMSAIVESTDDAIIGQDLNGVITSWNIGAEKLYGHTADEAIGQHVSIMIPEERRHEVSEYHATIAAGERLHTRDTVRLRKDGTEIHVSLTVSPVHDANHRLIGISKIARDVSERIAMETEIRQQIKQREAFLATLSHELRNPLGAALSASRVVANQNADQEIRREAARIVGRQIEMTRNLLSDLLDMSRVTQGKVELRREVVDLCKLVDLVRETTLSEARTHHQEVTWEIPPHSLLVEGDATRLVQVQVNLIHNALKYSPEHTEVRVVLAQQGTSATISVTDFGVGIPQDQLENVFEPFVQIGETLHQSEGGLGVGLTLVRSLVHAHGGEVSASSDGAGKGTTFHVALPLADATKANDGADTAVDQDAPIVARRVVLIEDIEDSRKMLSSLLTLDGHTVHACPDGETGIDAIIRHHPDVAVVDIGLPGIDGYEVARRVRSSPSVSRIHLIALTGFGQNPDLDRAAAAGFDTHLVKPIDPDHLSGVIGTLPRSNGLIQGDV